jgi:2-polyprenyl-3-methyl-5-hydroxy-6-metoxy-1,4-benzoquinol methylase
MPEAKSLDPGRSMDWGRTSEDYATHRPGPPQEFYERYRSLGVGFPGQRILDLGTGTGELARQFARQGARVCGTDIAAGQIEMARSLAAQEGLAVEFRVAPGEQSPYPDASFGAITANQVWFYFDVPRTIRDVKRLLGPGGLLAVSYFSALPREDLLVRESERLVLEFNPQWTGKDWNGYVSPIAKWAERDFTLKAMFSFDAAIPFTRESWAGRMRACRGIGAALSEEDVRRFDTAHGALLERIAPERFTVLHRLSAHILQPK